MRVLAQNIFIVGVGWRIVSAINSCIKNGWSLGSCVLLVVYLRLIDLGSGVRLTRGSSAIQPPRPFFMHGFFIATAGLTALATRTSFLPAVSKQAVPFRPLAVPQGRSFFDGSTLPFRQVAAAIGSTRSALVAAVVNGRVFELGVFERGTELVLIEAPCWARLKKVPHPITLSYGRQGTCKILIDALINLGNNGETFIDRREITSAHESSHV